MCLLPALIASAACGTGAGLASARPDAASTPADAGTATGATGATGADAPEGAEATLEDAVADVAADVASSASDATVDAADAMPPPDAAPDGAGSTCDAGAQSSSRQTVSLVVTNQTTADRFVVDLGWQCDALRFAPPDGGPLPLQLVPQCICECPNPGAAGPASVERLAPGASITLTWDARSITTCIETVDCVAQGWPNTPPASALVASAGPVAAGAYAATIAVFKALPANCSGAGPMIACSVGGGSTPPTYSTGAQSLCTSDVTSTATFMLPASGDVQVPLAITQ